MALTVPPLALFQTFTHLTADEINADWASGSLQQATDLFFLATGLGSDPTDPQTLRIVQTAIMEMAFALYIRDDDREEMFSPFSSESIGSYFYSRLAQAVKNGEPVGLLWWDEVVDWILSQQGGSVIWHSTEHVMDPIADGFWRGRLREKLWDRYRLLWGTDPTYAVLAEPTWNIG